MKSIWTCLLMGGLMLTGTGCVASYELSRRVGTMTTMSEDRIYPKKPKFTVQPETVTVDAGIDFDAVYYFDHSALPGVSSDGGNYFRFWPNGRVMYRPGGRKPIAEDADRFYGVWMGYYQVKEGKLVMEFFAPQPVDYRWTYWRLDGAVQGDKILLLREERNRKSEVKDRVYVKHAVPGVKRETDW